MIEKRKIIAIEGIDGSGKTPTISLVNQQLGEAGMKVANFAPYHLAKNRNKGKDIYSLWSTNPTLAVKLLHEVLEETESQISQINPDVVIYDRHWVTAFSENDEKEHVSNLWGDLFVPTFMLTSPLEHTLRLGKRGYSEPWMQDSSLAHYHKKYDEIFEQHPEKFVNKFTVTHSHMNLEDIAQEITKYLANK